MSNPYQAPVQAASNSIAAQQVLGPAIALLIVSAAAVVFGVLGLAADAFMILSGFVQRLEDMNEGPISEYVMITVRIIWGIILVIASTFVFYGALKMKNTTDYGTARTAAIVSMIPFVGPCCLLGIPFGVWAFIVLRKPHVKDAFH